MKQIADRVSDYAEFLRREELAESTIQKYCAETEKFLSFVGGTEIRKEDVLKWKSEQMRKYCAATVNAKISAVNGFLSFIGSDACRTKHVKLQRMIFREMERELSEEEYFRLLRAADERGNERLYYVMETICSTGIRISELQFITVDAVRTGRAEVACKGKRRVVFLTERLCAALNSYCRKRKIESGAVFVTESGKPLDRSNIWREMRRLCSAADVEPNKVYPHNFRHLFAVSFYRQEKDMAKLADLLGHASVDTTRIYIMESGKEHAKQVEKLGLVV